MALLLCKYDCVNLQISKTGTIPHLGFICVRAKKGAILQMWPQFESTYFQHEGLEEF
jgi:hypothetical protein